MKTCCCSPYWHVEIFYFLMSFRQFCHLCWKICWVKSSYSNAISKRYWMWLSWYSNCVSYRDTIAHHSIALFCGSANMVKTKDDLLVLDEVVDTDLIIYRYKLENNIFVTYRIRLFFGAHILFPCLLKETLIPIYVKWKSWSMPKTKTAQLRVHV